MKKLLAHLMVIAITLNAFTQPPEKLSYQAVVRNLSGELVKSSPVGIKICILQNSTDGIEVFAETHTTITNANGLITLEIGNGTPVTGTLAGIDWSNGTYFIKTKTDPSGGTNYTITGVSQILSVPYALHSKTAKTADYNDLLNKPELFSGNYSDLLNKPELFIGNYDNLTNKPELFSGNYNDLLNKPELFNGNYDSLTNKPELFNGNYDSLTNKPELFSGNYNDLTNKPELFSGNYDDLINKPELFDSSWTSITDKPTTLSGYGITDASTKEYVDDLLKALGLVHENFAGTLTDIDGNIYKTVKIGDQVWMAENLKTSRCNDGEVIPAVDSDLEWWSLITPGYSWFNKEIYGGLYNWYAVSTNKLCPTGWHVPNDAEWTTLVTTLGGDNIAGSKLQEAGTDYWLCDDRLATNSSGFTALPSGFRAGNDVNHAAILQVHDAGYWWISAEGSYATYGILGLFCESSNAGKFLINAPERGYSVRCLKD